MRKIVEQKKWVYTLYETDKGLMLSVVCGGVGIFEVEVFLTSNDIISMNINPDYLSELAEKIRDNPERFK
jgi:hypothetical protein